MRTTCALTGIVAFLSLSSPLAAQEPAPRPAPAYLEATKLEEKGDFDRALVEVNEALQLDASNAKAYVLRGDLYAKKKQWSEAKQDFTTALKLLPENPLAKFDLAEIQLMQKNYADARPGFVELTSNNGVGDLAAYKVFLCDLLGCKRDEAAGELRDFNEAATHGASYYYANAAWLLINKRPDDARSWLDSAARIYPPEKNHDYSSTLEELGYLPLPQ